MMEVVDESTLEEELKEADKVDWSSRSMAKIYHNFHLILS